MPWRLYSASAPAPAPAKDGAPEQPTWRLYGPHLNEFVIFVDPNTAWLFTDDLYGKLSANIWHKLSAGTHLGGIKIVRGYTEPRKPASRPATPPAGEKLTAAQALEAKFKRRSMPPPAKPTPQEETREAVLERRMSSAYGDASAQAALMEASMADDYEITDEPEREIEHLLLVTHGIGQKLSQRMESVNFVHDVNVFRKSLKGVYAAAPDLQVLNGENTASARKNCRIQCLPVCWRHLLDFPQQSRREQDIVGGDAYPSLEDITVDGAPMVRTLMTDLALDVLLYQSATYREHIIATVRAECNRIHALFCARNPGFRGKVSLVGHSLGSAIIFDILCRQPGPGAAPARRDAAPLAFAVDACFGLGSPVGLFQMLAGRTIAARVPGGSGSDDDGRLVSAPACAQLFNIFHPADPISYRIEPLVATAMAALKPQPLPYQARAVLGQRPDRRRHLGRRPERRARRQQHVVQPQRGNREQHPQPQPRHHRARAHGDRRAAPPADDARNRSVT